MKVYIATPVNARKEPTFIERFEKAKCRVAEIRKAMREMPIYKDAKFISTFDFNKSDSPESEAMGRCIKAVLQSDLVVLDDGWQNSRGCQLEREAAMLYGVVILYNPKVD